MSSAAAETLKIRVRQGLIGELLQDKNYLFFKVSILDCNAELPWQIWPIMGSSIEL